jgi:ubiquinone/menaquinone biosynthesis C-methylase UbiE
MQDFFELCRITYIAPCDAANTNLSDESIDFHTSNAVFEHIPLSILENILEEGNRIIKKEGLFIHNIDYSDHFAYSDKNISPINFLQYSDQEWNKYAGNYHAYVNRLRHDDFISLFKKARHEFLFIEPRKSQYVHELLDQSKIQLNEQFKFKGTDILSITSSLFITRKITQ